MLEVFLQMLFCLTVLERYVNLLNLFDLLFFGHVHFISGVRQSHILNPVYLWSVYLEKGLSELLQLILEEFKSFLVIVCHLHFLPVLVRVVQPQRVDLLRYSLDLKKILGLLKVFNA